MGDQKYRHVLPTTTSTFSPKGETEKRDCNDLHDALPLMCQGCQSARFKLAHDKTHRSLNRLESPSLVETVNFVKGLDHWLPFCQALKGYGGSCGRLIHDRSCFSIPQAEYIVRFSQAHHISVRLAGAVSMLWSVRTRRANDRNPGRFESGAKARQLCGPMTEDRSVRPRSL
jgi:hypothetical protein